MSPTITLIQIEALLDRKLDEKLDQKLDEKLGVFAEHLEAKFNGLIEAFEVMSSVMARDSDLQELKQEVKVIRRVVTDTNRDLHAVKKKVVTMDKRLIRVETSLAAHA